MQKIKEFMQLLFIVFGGLCFAIAIGVIAFYIFYTYVKQEPVTHIQPRDICSKTYST